MSNIWIAAADGDLVRVQQLVPSLTANARDENGYSVLHAATSYGHLEMIQWLLDQGADINIVDNDGDTPLYTVESIPVARFLVEQGALVDRTNLEGISPIEHLTEDFPDVARFLRTLNTPDSVAAPPVPQPSQYAQNMTTEQLTDSLLESIKSIDPNDEEQLRAAVQRSVIEGVIAGVALSQQTGEPSHTSSGSSPKKQKTEEADDNGTSM